MLLGEEKREINDVQRRYIAAWMNILIDGRAAVGFWNRKRIEAKLKSSYRELGIDEKNEPASTAQLEEWRSFAQLWIETCVRDRTYSSTAFGMFHLRDESLAKKIAEELDEVSRGIPMRIGISDSCLQLRSVLIEEYCRLLPIGSSYFS